MLLKNQKIKIAFLLICMFCFQISCTTNRYRQPILKFQAASAVVTSTARESLTELNRSEISRIILQRRLKGQTIFAKDIEDAKKIKFKDLKVRLDALDRLDEYANLLVSIANSDSPDNIAKSATDLNTAITNLAVTVNNLAGGSNDSFKSKFSFAGSILSEILRAFAQKKIKEALNLAISKGKEPVNELIDAIGDDLTVAFSVTETGLIELRTELLRKYNVVASTSPVNENQLEVLSNKIIATNNSIEILEFANPKAALNQMKKAHSKIVLHAETRTPATFADAVEEIEAFVGAVQRLSAAVKELKNQDV